MTVTDPRYSASWDPKTSAGMCAAGLVDPNAGVTLTAATLAGLTPVWTVGWDGYYQGHVSSPAERTSEKGTAYIGTTLRYSESGPQFSRTHRAHVGLTYCTPLDVTIDPVLPDGRPMSPSDLALLEADGLTEYRTPPSLLDDGGGCPASLMGLPSSAQKVGLTEASQQRWVGMGVTLNGTDLPTGQNPVMRVAADGATSDEAHFKVTPLCFQLVRTDRVDLDTEPNCPGHAGAAWYVANTPVVVHWRPVDHWTFEGWSGTDATDDQYAVVVMNQERRPVAQWHRPSKGQEVLNVLSSIGQRLVSGLVTLAVGLLGKVVVVGKVASLLLDGIAAGLSAVGVRGSAIDGIKQGSRAITATVDLLSETTRCFKTWSAGGSAPIVPTPVNLTVAGVGGGAAVTRFAAGTSYIDNPNAVAYATKVGDAATVVGGVVLATDLFASGPDAYLNDAAEGWNSIVDVGKCVEPAIDKVYAGGKDVPTD